MTLAPRNYCRCIFLCLLLAGLPAAAAPPTPAQSPRHNPMLHQQGMRLVDGQGHPVQLRGVAVGGWLIWEGWIFGNGILTPEATIVRRLEKLVGRQQTEQFRAQIYNQFITEADFEKIAAAGFNCVRVPFHYRIFNDDTGWQLLDRILNWCERHRLYAVLDLQMIPGSTLGMLEPEPIWTSAKTRGRMIEIWTAIARRYHQRKLIVGWSFWTWKKVGDNFPGLVTIHAPRNWATVMAYVASLWGTNPPSAATTNAGMKEYFEAMKLKNCNYDSRMERILLRKGH